MAGSNFETPTLGIGRLLREGSRFLVPHHQRDYSWTEDQIEQLFAEIDEARRLGQSEYFVGLMVFMPSDSDQFVILDGQQRLATASIILSAVRNWLSERDHDEDSIQVQKDYIAVRELGSADVEPRLVLNQNNNPFFVKHVVSKSPLDNVESELTKLSRYDPSRQLLEAILTCRTKIDEMAKRAATEDDDGSRELFEFTKFLQDGVKFVRLNVKSESDAYTVFETLNDRGLDLTVLDLVKNYLFGKAGNATRLSEVQTYWTQMMANLINVPADNFLKAWWTSRKGRVQTAQLFPKFKQWANTSARVVSVSDDMRAASEQYAALEVADDPVWAGLSEKGVGHVRSLKLLGAKQVHPVLLSALERFDAAGLEQLLWSLEVLIVRYQLIGGRRTGRLEIACANAALQIWNKGATDVASVRALLREIYVPDDEFKNAFRSKQEKNSKKAVWILSKLEAQARRAAHSKLGGDELEPSGNLTLEHVLPKRPSEAWDAVIEQDEHLSEDMTFRLGNLCLLNKVNKSLGNKAFDIKKPYFERSDLILTRGVAAARTWNRQSIDHRQARLAKLAVAYWRYE